jgi:hypothetical protein
MTPRALLCGLALLALAACESTGSNYGYGSSSVSGGYYHGSGWYDPYYYDRCCYNRPPPPPVNRPPRPTHPIEPPPGFNRPPAARPRPLPSVPRQPRPARRR